MLPQRGVRLPAVRGLQQALQAAQAPCRRAVRSTVAEKGSYKKLNPKWTLCGVFQSAKLMKFAVLERWEGRLRGFLAFSENVAGLPSIFRSVVVFCSLLLKSWDLFSNFFSVFFLVYSPQRTVQYFSCALLMPHGAGGFLHIQLTALLFLFCALVPSLFAAGCDSI